jgi:rod shape-determining protein MreC
MRNSRRTRLVLTVLLLAAFSLITLDYRTGALSSIRKGASDVFGPIENGVDAVTHPIGSFFSSLGHLSSYKNDNAALKAQVARLQGQLHLTQAQRSELAQDQKLLHLAGIAQFKVVAARVTGYGSNFGFDETVTINRGSANGIQANETVITGDGLVGRTLSPVGRTSATVLLANDPTFAVGARVEGKQLELGSVQGGGVNKAMDLQLYSNNALLTEGQQLVSAGDTQNGNRPFAPEVPIGTITHVNPLNRGLAETAVIKPFVNFTALNIVAVVVHSPTNIKHDSLLPASPTPAPTVTVTVTATPGSTPSSGAGTGGSSPPSGTSPTTSSTP